MKAVDIMTTHVQTITADHSVSHAAQIMQDHHVSGLPVLDDEEQLKGIITEGDLMRRVELGQATLRSDLDEEIMTDDELAKSYIKSHSWKVGDVMSKDIISVDENAPLDVITFVLAENDIKRVPVLREGKLIGIVSRADVLRGISGSSNGRQISGDEALRRAIISRLQTDIGLPRVKTSVTVSNAQAFLWGRVATKALREAARVAAENVPGVEGVTNHLRVVAELPVEHSPAPQYEPHHEV